VVWWLFFPKSRKKSGKKIISKRNNLKKKEKNWGWVKNTKLIMHKNEVFHEQNLRARFSHICLMIVS
jgi:hypothetical protein